MDYNLIFILPENKHLLIDWGNSPNWLTKYEEELARATLVKFSPKTPKNFLAFQAVLIPGEDFKIVKKVLGKIAPNGGTETYFYLVETPNYKIASYDSGFIEVMPPEEIPLLVKVW